MDTGLFIGAGKAFLPLLCIINLLLLTCPMQAQGDGNVSVPSSSYCSVPPMPGFGVKPNLLLMIDNSASMYDLAYTDPSAYCVDDSYDNTKSYPGYFDQGTRYSYDSSGKKFDPFPSGVTVPSGCNAVNTSYLCLNMNPVRQVNTFTGSGKFLNWLSMSKLDIEKQVLTGGKFDGTSGTLLAETRGCLGKRFVKIVPGASQITFGVRGPIPSESDYVYSASHGGGTRIEVYDKQYNKTACLAAVADWQNSATLSALRTDATGCMGAANLTEMVGNIAIPSKSQVFIDIMSNCYAHPTNVVGDGIVLNDCQARIDHKYNSNGNNVLRGVGDDVCAAGLDHALAVHGVPPDVYQDRSGFLGDFYNQFNSTNRWDDPVHAEWEAEDYCREITNPALTDPSTGNMAGTNMNVPSFILDAGIYSVGDVSGVFRARVSSSSPPTGVIQQFSNDINFSAMIFNDDGAGPLECKQEDPSIPPNGGINYGDIPCLVKGRCIDGPDAGAECHLDDDCYSTCQLVPPTDGGKILSSIGSPLGDHTSGLIASIDQVTANAWTPLAESFYNAMGYFANRTDLRLQPADFPDPSPSKYGSSLSDFRCQRNNILIVSDGTSTADRHPAVNNLVANTVHPSSMTTTGTETSPPFKGSYNLDDLAWIARNKNIADFSKPVIYNKDYLSTYVVYTGVPCGDYYNDGTCKTTDEGVPEKMMQLAATKGGGRIASAQNPNDLKKAFSDMLQQMAAPGTDAAILSTGDGNGAIFLQEQFYPTKSFDGGTTSASWIGEMQSLWYYIDPFIGNTAGTGSTIREDTVADLTLNLKNDRIVSLRFDAGSNRTYAYLTADTNGDGLAEGAETRVEVDQVKSLWRAGQKLWARDLTASPRTIYTPLLTGGTQTVSTGLMQFSYWTIGSATFPDNSSVLQPYLQMSGNPGAVKLMKYVHGFDFPNDPAMRSRTVTIGAIPASVSDPQNRGVGVWKLGDIISSTPQVQSTVALGKYNLPSPKGYNDLSYISFITSNDYKSRGMVYVGANDGMLHAFNLGGLNASVSGDVKATLTGSDLGNEQWAFIPKNALPYLTYLKEPSYQHLYYMDGGITLADVSIGDTNNGACVKNSYWSCDKPANAQKKDNSHDLDPAANTWRTVLIGGMGLGGASAASCQPGTDCVPIPLAGLGYSSYFALDVTDPNKPQLLWEFSDPSLGFATTGAAFVRVGNSTKNGRWFAVFGSGPTGPIDTGTHQFKGRSSQTLKFFVVDLRTGALVKTIDTGIANAFAGSLNGGAIDADRWDPSATGIYQDDAIYVGYVKKLASGSTWTDGGMGRIMIDQVADPSDANVANIWHWSRVMDGIGPVTTSIAKLQDRKNRNLWLYGGTGRYYYRDSSMPDDHDGSRMLFGVKEPCYNKGLIGNYLDRSCTDLVTGSLVNQTSSISALNAGDKGWRIDLDPRNGAVGAERLITNPTSTTGGAVFFTTFQPNADPCLFGDSYLWGVKYDTGGAITNGSLQGKALVQLSTGSMQETGLGTLTEGGRRSQKMTGKPGGVKIVSNSGLRPLKKIIHIQER